VLVAALSHRTTLSVPNSIPVMLLESPPQQQQEQTAPRDLPRPIEKRKPEPQLPVKRPAPVRPSPAPVKPKDEPIKPAESKVPAQPIQPEPENGAETNGGAPAGTSAFSPESQAGLVSGPGSGGGGGNAVAGLGRGSGTPGPPVQTGPLRTNRLAKPIQSVRPVYPPLALKMGMQGDVTLKITVDSEGNVSRAEIVGSSGAEFDQEALKAVKQSRFEPAQKDGQNVAAEFNYVYRFRLQR